MRALILILVLLAVAGGFYLQSQSDEPDSGEEIVGRTGDAGDGPQTPPNTQLGGLNEPQVPTETRSEPPDGPVPAHMMSGGPMRTFEGIALVRREGAADAQAFNGTIEAELLLGGKREALPIGLNDGRFRIEVPTRCRIHLLGGTLDGELVRFDEPKGPFEPTNTSDWALVGIVCPRVEIAAVDGESGAVIDKLSVTRVHDATSVTLEGVAPEIARGDALVRDAASPATLPATRIDRPVWLRVASEGYAATNVLIDVRESGTHEVQLWRSADLDLTIAGPARDRVLMLLATRHLTGDDRVHAGTINISKPGVQRDANSLVFRLRGLAARPHTLTVKGRDRRGRMHDLGSIDVDLGPNELRTAELVTQ